MKKQKQSEDKSAVIKDFIDWLERKKGVCLAVHTDSGLHYVPVKQSDLIKEFVKEKPNG